MKPIRIPIRIPIEMSRYPNVGIASELMAFNDELTVTFHKLEGTDQYFAVGHLHNANHDQILDPLAEHDTLNDALIDILSVYGWIVGADCKHVRPVKTLSKNMIRCTRCRELLEK